MKTNNQNTAPQAGGGKAQSGRCHPCRPARDDEFLQPLAITDRQRMKKSVRTR